MGSAASSPSRRTSDIAVDSRGLGREAGLLPNRGAATQRRVWRAERHSRRPANIAPSPGEAGRRDGGGRAFPARRPRQQRASPETEQAPEEPGCSSNEKRRLVPPPTSLEAATRSRVSRPMDWPEAWGVSYYQRPTGCLMMARRWPNHLQPLARGPSRSTAESPSSPAAAAVSVGRWPSRWPRPARRSW